MAWSPTGSVIWTNADQVHWRIYAVVEGDESKYLLVYIWVQMHIYYNIGLIHTLSDIFPLIGG